MPGRRDRVQDIASRLERLTRELETPLVVSDPLVQALGTPEPDEAAPLSRLRDRGTRTIRGRENGVSVWDCKAMETI